VAQNDDLRRDDSDSRVLFNAIAGVEYAIAVDGMKTNGTAGNVVLTILQATPGPRITVQPAAWTSVPVKSTGFALEVTVDGAPGSNRFQWFFNGGPIPNATEARYPLGSLSRARSGVYFVTVTNGSGSTVSNNATVWVEVPQILACPELLADGTVRLRFADPDGTVAPSPDRFQVQHAPQLGSPEDSWTTTPGVIRLDAGRWMFDDRTVIPGEPMRTYRVVEQ
jgi:hypothetical protein